MTYTCPKCSTQFERTFKSSYAEVRFKGFCSRKCANSRTWTKENNEKRSLKLLKREKVVKKNKGEAIETPCPPQTECPICKKLYNPIFRGKTLQSCSQECSSKLRSLNRQKAVQGVFGSIDTTIPKRQGNLGVARAIYEYARLGYTVLAPLSDSDKYDLVVDDGEFLKRVQVKTTTSPSCSGGWNVGIKTTGGNRKINTIKYRQKGDYDLLFILAASGDCWSIPEEALGEIASALIVGGTKYQEYKIQ